MRASLKRRTKSALTLPSPASGRGEKRRRFASDDNTSNNRATMTLPADFVDALRATFQSALETDVAVRAVYGYDNSRREAMPDAVVFPSTHAQVVALVRACRAHRTPLVARGRGTNTTGASVPIEGGVVASFERMNRIVAIDPANRLAVVEPGVLNADLQIRTTPARAVLAARSDLGAVLHDRRQPRLQRRRPACGEIRRDARQRARAPRGRRHRRGFPLRHADDEGRGRL